MSYLINDGLHNSVLKKAISCDLKEKIYEAKDNAIKDPKVKMYYDSFYAEYFDEWNEEEYSIGKCIEFLANYNHNDFIQDVQVYSTERYLENPGDYDGISNLQSGAEVIILHICAEEHAFEMIQVVYFDGEKLHTFTPFEGNAVNVIAKTCLGNEAYAIDTDVDYSHPLVSVVYPMGLTYKVLTDEEHIDEHFVNYLTHFGVSRKDAKDECVSLNEKAIYVEIESVLG